jgi:hypothetical protein
VPLQNNKDAARGQCVGRRVADERTSTTLGKLSVGRPTLLGQQYYVRRMGRSEWLHQVNLSTNKQMRILAPDKERTHTAFPYWKGGSTAPNPPRKSTKDQAMGPSIEKKR